MTQIRYAPVRERSRYIIWRPTPTHKAHITNGYPGARNGTVKAVCGFEALLLGGKIDAKRSSVCVRCLKTCELTGTPVEGLA